MSRSGEFQRAWSQGGRHRHGDQKADRTVASMEPASFRAGDPTRSRTPCTSCSCLNGARLFQGGRPDRVSVTARTPISASMEPASFRAGDQRGTVNSEVERPRLNGARLFQGGRRGDTVPVSARDGGASMEPASFRAGDSATSTPSSTQSWPQWSPPLSGRET